MALRVTVVNPEGDENMFLVASSTEVEDLKELIEDEEGTSIGRQVLTTEDGTVLDDDDDLSDFSGAIRILLTREGEEEAPPAYVPPSTTDAPVSNPWLDPSPTPPPGSTPTAPPASTGATTTSGWGSVPQTGNTASPWGAGGNPDNVELPDYAAVTSGADQPAGGFVLGAERRSSVLANHTVDSTVVCTKCYVKKSRAMFDATDLKNDNHVCSFCKDTGDLAVTSSNYVSPGLYETNSTHIGGGSSRPARRRRSFSMPSFSMPEIDFIQDNEELMGQIAACCLFICYVFFWAAFILYFTSVHPTNKAQDWTPSVCTVTETYFYSVESCDDDGCSTSYYCDVTSEYDQYSGVADDPRVQGENLDGSGFAINYRAEETCEFFANYEGTDQTLTCYFDPDDPTDYVFTIDHVPRTIRSTMVMFIIAAVSCVCACCIGLLTFQS